MWGINKKVKQIFVNILQFIWICNRISDNKKWRWFQMNEIEKNENYSNQSFEDIKHIDENGIEYWYARELMKVLS